MSAFDRFCISFIRFLGAGISVMIFVVCCFAVFTELSYLATYEKLLLCSVSLFFALVIMFMTAFEVHDLK